MTDVDYENYTSLFHVLVAFLRKPDLILYLKASPAVLMERIAQARPAERAEHHDRLSLTPQPRLRRLDAARAVEMRGAGDRHRSRAAPGRDRRLPATGRRPQAALSAPGRAPAGSGRARLVSGPARDQARSGAGVTRAHAPEHGATPGAQTVRVDVLAIGPAALALRERRALHRDRELGAGGRPRP